MRRRRFLSLIGGVAVAWSKAVRAQALPVVGYLGVRPPGAEEPYLAAFRRGLNESGYVEGRNVVLAIASAESASERLPPLANELIHRGAGVIAAAGTATARAVLNATASIPIVFVTADDPIDNGLATNLNRPTGNATGVSMVSAELRPKMLELLHQALPNLEFIYVLANPNNGSIGIQTEQTQAAAAKMGVRVKIVKAANPSDIDTEFARLSSNPGSGLLVNSDPFFTGQRTQIVKLAAQYAVPAIYPWREYVLEGGLMSYGSNSVESYRIAGTYVARILQGIRSEELPIWQPTKFELVLNLKTAKSLGVTFPSSMVVIADEVIE